MKGPYAVITPTTERELAALGVPVPTDPRTGKPVMSIVPDAYADIADYLVCSPLGTGRDFPDNLIGDCSRCGRAVQFRPHSPTKPAKLCLICWLNEGKRA